MTSARDQTRPLTFVFDDDGLVPNNILPLVIYKRAIELAGGDPARAIDELFRANGWDQRWRDGIFDYQHYHATCTRRSASRAATRWCCSAASTARRSSSTPATSRSCPPAPATSASSPAMISAWSAPTRPAKPWRSLARPRRTYRRAMETIPLVLPPPSDPVFGQDGPLLRLWRV